MTPSQLKWHEILKTHASDGMYFTSKPEPRPQNRRSTLDSFLDTSKYKNSESDLRKAHEHLEIVDQQAREAASKGKRHALKREFEVYVRAWSSRISLFHYVTQITRISLTHTTTKLLENHIEHRYSRAVAVEMERINTLQDIREHLISKIKHTNKLSSKERETVRKLEKNGTRVTKSWRS